MREDIYDFIKVLIYFFISQESAGQVLAEAMLFGLPMVTWNIIGVNEMFNNGVQGRMRELGDINGIIKDVREFNLSKFI